MEIRLFHNPKGRKPEPLKVITPPTRNVRINIRLARAALRKAWAALPTYQPKDVIRVGVYNDEGKLEYQARISGESALNGYRRMIVAEER